MYQLQSPGDISIISSNPLFIKTKNRYNMQYIIYISCCNNLKPIYERKDGTKRLRVQKCCTHYVFYDP